MNDFDRDLAIDPDMLDVAWLAQAGLMWKYSKMSAELRKKMDAAKENLDVVKAEIDKEIRSTPSNYGIEKITEAVVQNTILVTNKYQNANADFLDCKYEFEMSRAAVMAIEQRKDALENLVRLHGQSYFAGPTVPHDLSKEWESAQRDKESDIRIAEAMKLKRTRKSAELTNE